MERRPLQRRELEQLPHWLVTTRRIATCRRSSWDGRSEAMPINDGLWLPRWVSRSLSSGRPKAGPVGSTHLLDRVILPTPPSPSAGASANYKKLCPAPDG